jgi:hypothetical protein
MTQLLDLLLLAPDIQARGLELEAIDGVEPMSERSLRATVRASAWDRQRETCALLGNDLQRCGVTRAVLSVAGSA